jgi:hypothetical protein
MGKGEKRERKVDAPPPFKYPFSTTCTASFANSSGTPNRGGKRVVARREARTLRV